MFASLVCVAAVTTQTDIERGSVWVFFRGKSTFDSVSFERTVITLFGSDHVIKADWGTGNYKPKWAAHDMGIWLTEDHDFRCRWTGENGLVIYGRMENGKLKRVREFRLDSDPLREEWRPIIRNPADPG